MYLRRKFVNLGYQTHTTHEYLMSEREYRRDESRKRDSDEGDIARYERYRYGGGNPQYNDIGSAWSMEQLANTPDDIDGTLIHTPEEQAEVIDVSSQPKMAWELDDFTRGDPLDDEWDYTDEWLNKTQVASNHLNAGWSEIGNKDNYNGIDTSNWKTPDGRDLAPEDKQQIASVYQGSTIPGFVIASYGALGSRALWRAFGQIVARRFGERAAIAATINAGDPISPIAELLTLGLGVLTIYQIYRAWDEIWKAADDLLSQQVLESYIPPPDSLPGFPDAQLAPRKTRVQGGGGLRKRWKERKGKKRIIEWDSQHGKVEVYNKKGKHLGEYDHDLEDVMWIVMMMKGDTLMTDILGNLTNG